MKLVSFVDVSASGCEQHRRERMSHEGWAALQTARSELGVFKLRHITSGL